MTRAERIQRIEHLEQHYKQLSDEIARYFKHPDDRANCPAKLVNHTIEGSQPEPNFRLTNLFFTQRQTQNNISSNDFGTAYYTQTIG